MTRYTIIVSVAVLGICQAAALANCPFGYTNEIFCDDFDTYCLESGGGHHPGDLPKCPTDGSATRNDQYLKDTWFRWPPPVGDPGTEMLVADNQAELASGPYGGRWPCQGDARLGNITIRDWVHSGARSGPEEGQIRNMVWLLEDTFGAGTATVTGTDANPLNVYFLLNAATSGKIYQNNGYVELTLGEDKAQTDYYEHEHCSTYCSPAINQGPFRVICAQGNPDGTMPTACPDQSLYPAPIHASIAVGVLGMLDTDPCHCGSTTAHGSTQYHLVVYDGQKWWSLRSNNPYPSSGTVTPKGDSVMPPPEDINEPGDFALNGGCSVPGAKSHNFITLTIKSTTFDVTHVGFQASCSGTSNKYWVSSVMEGIPRAYKYDEGQGLSGAFDSIRLGISAHCNLTDNTDWNSCENPPRRTPRTYVPNAGVCNFDEFVVYGGEPETVAGACCDPSTGICTDDVLPENCVSPLSYRGPNTSCSTELCCVDPFADADADGDVDLTDFGLWQACFSGATVAYPAGCECFDQHPSTPDNDVDSDDLTAFLNCWSGPTVPLNAACDD